MKKERVHRFIFTLIILLAITVYSIYQDYKNAEAKETLLPSPTTTTDYFLIT